MPFSAFPSLAAAALPSLGLPFFAVGAACYTMGMANVSSEGRQVTLHWKVNLLPKHLLAFKELLKFHLQVKVCWKLLINKVQVLNRNFTSQPWSVAFSEQPFPLHPLHSTHRIPNDNYTWSSSRADGAEVPQCGISIANHYTWLHWICSPYFLHTPKVGC